MTFTVQDLSDFLLAYNGHEDQHQSILDFWNDLTAPSDLEKSLAGAPYPVREYIHLNMGTRFADLGAKTVVTAPFGDISLDQIEEDEEPGWFKPRKTYLKVNGRTFLLTSYPTQTLDDEDPELSFRDSTLVEIEDRARTVRKVVPLTSGLTLPLNGEYTWTDLGRFPGEYDDVDSTENPARIHNVAWAVSGMNPVMDSHGNIEWFLREVYDRAITLPDGSRIRQMDVTRHPHEDEDYVVVLQYRGDEYVLTFGWDSYGGVMTHNGTIQDAHFDFVPTVETHYVSQTVSILHTPADFFDFDGFFDSNNESDPSPAGNGSEG